MLTQPASRLKPESANDQPQDASIDGRAEETDQRHAQELSRRLHLRASRSATLRLLITPIP
jgi:hypothetical protein